MNDPYVSALLYRVKHDETKVNYEKAVPLEHETARFKVSIKNLEARFEMKEHFPTAEQAQEVVKPFIRLWEFITALDRPGEFELVFQNAVIEDRRPTPGTLEAAVREMVLVSDSPSAVVGRGTYPEPPKDVAMNADVADVEVMAFRYSLYKGGKDTIAAMAYFCLTVLEAATGKRGNKRRKAAAVKFGVEFDVLAKLGQLTGEKGGAEARKSGGRSSEFTESELRWIDQTTKRLIRRVAEIAHDPAATAPKITMGDLPKL
jgi:hypothetical protein